MSRIFFPTDAISEHQWTVYYRENRRRQAQKKLDNAESHLLGLPVELILIVVQNLPLVNKLLLAQTCRSLYTVVDGFIPRDPAADNRRLPIRRLLERHYARIDYLTCMARDSLDAWVCEPCVAIHPACFHDTPADITETSCPHGWTTADQWNFVTLGRYIIKHNHVQTALKYYRNWSLIGRGEKDYLKMLLMPKHHISMSRDVFWERMATTEFWAEPKIVRDLTASPALGNRCKFLVRTVRRYSSTDEPINRARMGTVHVCLHCSWIGEIDCFLRPFPDPDDPLQCVISKAFNSGKYEEAQGACEKCSTDFSLHVKPEVGSGRLTATLRTWHDLGGEGPMTDPAWRVFEDWNRHPSVGLINSERGYFHEPGSVRKSYEESEVAVPDEELQGTRAQRWWTSDGSL